MRHLLPTAAAVLTTLVARSQCDISIPSNALVITIGGTTVDVSDTVVWICGDVTSLVLSGDNNTYIMAGFGSVGLSGTNNTAYIRNGNYWYITGNGNTVYEGYAADAQVGGGSTSTVIECPTMIIDFSNAPTPGCSTVGIDEPGLARPWSAAFKGDVLDITQHGTSGTYLITDPLGRTVKSGGLRTGHNTVELRSLSAGNYMLVDAARRSVVLRFSKP